MTNLERSAKKDTVGMIVTVIIYAIGAASVPYIKIAEWLGGGDSLEWYLGFAFKTLCAVLPVYLIFQFGFKKMLTSFSGGIKGFVVCLSAFLVAIDNFPFIPIFSGDMYFAEFGVNEICSYSLYCLSIGIIEELIFRGNLLPLFMYKFEHTKKGLFFSVICSSAVFGAMHLLNLFGGFSPYVFLQVGYSFLIGSMCAVALLSSGNVWVAVLIHAIFDFGGFLSDSGFCSGVLWTTKNIVATAVISVVLALCIIIVFFKTDYSKRYDEWSLNETPVL